MRSTITLLFSLLCFVSFGNNKGAELTFSVSTLTFDETVVGETAEKTIKISNTGDAPMFIMSAALGEPFSVKEMPGTLQPGSEFDLTVVFTPTEAGDFNQSLTFSGSHSNQDEALAISGTGAAASTGALLTYAESTMVFDDVTVGETLEKTIKISNTGDAPMFIMSAALEAPFSVKELPGMLSPGAEFDLIIVFAPTEAGDFAKSLTFSGSHSNADEALAISGKGVEASTGAILTYAEATMVFDDVTVGETLEKTIKISNTGDAPMFIMSAALEAPFSVKELPGMLSPGAEFDLIIVFAPTEAGDFAKSLTFSGSHSNADEALAISGKGVEAPTGAILTYAEATMVFDDVTVGETLEKNIKISNTGDAPMFIMSAALEAPFSVKELPGMLSPGAETEITIVFAPTEAGDFTKSLTFSGSHSNADEALEISGKGVEASTGAILTYAESTMVFDDVTVGETLEKTIKISNTGDAPLFIMSAALEAPFSVKELPGMLSPGAETEITIVFAPTEAGDFTKSLTFSGSHSNADEALEISGKGIEAVGLAELNEMELDLYPNPASNNISVSSKFNIEHVSIISLSGKVMKSIPVEAKSTVIDVSDLENGIYLVHVKDLSSSYVKKLVIE